MLFDLEELHFMYKLSLCLKKTTESVLNKTTELALNKTTKIAYPNSSYIFLLQKGTKAPQAAGKIHTDFEKGFIMAEVGIFQLNHVFL